LASDALSSPATEQGISGSAGSLQLSLPTAGLPFGEAAYELHLVDAAGNESAAAAFAFAVLPARSGGTPPVLSSLGSAFTSIAPPRAPQDVVAPLIAFDYADAEGDYASVRVEIERPDGTR